MKGADKMANKKLKAPVNIPVEKIHPFEGHPYKVLDNDEMNNLIESIQQKGVISPIVVRLMIIADTVFFINGISNACSSSGSYSENKS